MSLIRQALNLREPAEYIAEAMRIDPPQNVKDPFRVTLLLINGEEILLEAYSINFRSAMINANISRKDLCVKLEGEGCISKLKLSFPRGALVIADNGNITIE
ncbi:MAG: hypothetical protein QW039_03260 [Fervidicoccaceae archaeon]